MGAGVIPTPQQLLVLQGLRAKSPLRLGELGRLSDKALHECEDRGWAQRRRLVGLDRGSFLSADGRALLRQTTAAQVTERWPLLQPRRCYVADVRLFHANATHRVIAFTGFDPEDLLLATAGYEAGAKHRRLGSLDFMEVVSEVRDMRPASCACAAAGAGSRA